MEIHRAVTVTAPLDVSLSQPSPVGERWFPKQAQQRMQLLTQNAVSGASEAIGDNDGTPL